jgi:hypothetical protein
MSPGGPAVVEEQRHPGFGSLGRGHVEIVQGRFDHERIFAALGNSHDLDHTAVDPGDAQPFADGALLGIVFTRKKLIDNVATRGDPARSVA